MRKLMEKISDVYLKLGGDIRVAHRIEDTGRKSEDFLKENGLFFLEVFLFLLTVIFFYTFGLIILEVIFEDILGVKT